VQERFEEKAAGLAPAGDAEAPVDESIILAGETFMPLAAALESLLFVADKPVDAAQLARALRIQPEAVEVGLAQLAASLQDNARGLRLLEQSGHYRLVTRPDVAAAVEEFLNLDLSTRLSGPALETLAVIAYRQPATRAQIEAVRGVDCGGVLRTLVQRGLVEEMGRLEGLGRPIVYGITEQFMHHFGLTNLHELPPLPNADAELLATLAEAADVAGTPSPPVASA
jgi:segregation and condensation protein B